MRKLTEVERELVEENHNLIYAFLNQRNLDIEMYYGLIAESLCKAVMNWDKSRGRLSTYFYRIATLDLYQHWRMENAKKRTNEGEIELIHNCYSNDHDLEEEVVLLDIIECIRKSEYRDYFDLRLEGYTQNEIAEKLGVSQATVSRKLIELGDEYFNRT